MIGRDVGIRTPNHLAVSDPVHADGPQQTQRVEEVTAVENIVYDALEVISVVREGHLVVGIGALQCKTVHELWFVDGRFLSHQRPHRLAESGQEPVVGEALQVRVVYVHLAVNKEVHDSRVRQGIQVSAHENRDARHPWDEGLVPDPSLALHALGNGFQLLHQHDRLYELDVSELWVPVYVGVGHQEVVGGAVELGGGVLQLQQYGNANVVPEHDPVEHGL